MILHTGAQKIPALVGRGEKQELAPDEKSWGLFACDPPGVNAYNVLIAL
jgi:hypothetical protein